jgi:hypothetical protein
MRKPIVNLDDVEVCEYPDANKVGVFASEPGTTRFRKLFRAETDVEYYDREQTEPPKRDAL